ncbi:flocculation protein FLO11-like [Cucumis melo var. makuwa]|uniref:Flocculation protein FLO11-like n=2 Tax=Cucumis melo TaxID=3656 RepID=A0A5D3DZG0_CUCMM|nr:flocculation protein FLO11-like [Cucumis melo var. makuwa]TYK29056.1 flocculation protein FLO11-like [Cucumis melo var. makuwa]
MVVTHFKSYQPTSIPSVHCSYVAIDSSSMAPSPRKNASPVKGKHYKSISLRHPFKKVRCSDATDDSNLHISSASSVQSAHASTSSSHAPSVIVKIKVPDGSPPRFTQPSASSSISRSRVSIETVILDLDSASSNSDESIVLSKLLRRLKTMDRSGPLSTLAPTAQGTRSPPCDVSPPPRDVPPRTAYRGKSHVPQASSYVTPSSSKSPEESYGNDEDQLSEDTDEDYVLGSEKIPVFSRNCKVVIYFKVMDSSSVIIHIGLEC